MHLNLSTRLDSFIFQCYFMRCWKASDVTLPRYMSSKWVTEFKINTNFETLRLFFSSFQNNVLMSLVSELQVDTSRYVHKHELSFYLPLTLYGCDQTGPLGLGVALEHLPCELSLWVSVPRPP